MTDRPRSEDRPVTRRRALTIVGSAAAGGLAALLAGRVRAAAVYEWRGMALGAETRILLAHADRARAAAAVRAVADEVDRLEDLFSLYRAQSAVCRLNRAGRLAAAPLELVELIRRSLWYGRITGGAFDITVQPLWRLYADHFADRPDAEGPDARALAAARRRTGPGRVHLMNGDIHLDEGTELTFNGIAQGYITDRAADLLRARGWRNVLLNLGEIRALDDRPGGGPWRVGLPGGEGHALAGGALATSGAGATRFSRDGRYHHLLDPATGRPAARTGSVTVAAPRAVDADALSTALFVTDRRRWPKILRNVPKATIIQS